MTREMDHSLALAAYMAIVQWLLDGSSAFHIKTWRRRSSGPFSTWRIRSDPLWVAMMRHERSRKKHGIDITTTTSPWRSQSGCGEQKSLSAWSIPWRKRKTSRWKMTEFTLACLAFHDFRTSSWTLTRCLKTAWMPKRRGMRPR